MFYHCFYQVLQALRLEEMLIHPEQEDMLEANIPFESFNRLRACKGALHIEDPAPKELQLAVGFRLVQVV